MRRTYTLGLICAAALLLPVRPLAAQTAVPLRPSAPARTILPERHAPLAAPAALRHRPGKSSSMPTLGDTLMFNTEGFLNSGWRPIPFKLMAEDPRFHLWVSLAELDNGQVDDAAVAALADALGRHTPPGSIDAGRGILENNAAFFGDAPNTDGDGVLDVLWFDIFDDFPSGPPLLGYIAAQDYDDAAPPGEGNAADVIYLDTDPLLVHANFGPASVAEMAASLHQSLIHFNYDRAEETFIIMGLSGFAGALNGYDGPSAGYLLDPLEHNIDFLSWGDFLGDAERGALFMHYLAEQYGDGILRTLTQEQSHGADGLEAALAAHGASRTLGEVVFDFHTANRLNDTSADPAFGYTDPAHATLSAAPTRLFDGGLATSTPTTTVELAPGGVQYLVWEDVQDFRLTLDAEASGSVRVRAFEEQPDGRLLMTEPAPGPEEQFFPGDYARLTLILSNTDVRDAPSTVTYAAAWTSLQNVQNVVYDDGSVSGDLLGLPAGDWRQAVRFEVPMGAALGIVSLAPLFPSQLPGGGVSPIAPRDLTLTVWADDGAGLPGAALFSVEITDPRPFFFTRFSLDFFTVDLSGEAALSTLPPVIHIGISDAGTDDNRLFGVFSQYTVADVTAIFGPINGLEAWYPLWGLASGTTSFSNKVAPIRAQFLLDGSPTPVEPPTALPTTLTLHAPHPNPFATTATLRFDLAQPTPLRVRIFDVLGREVARLADGPYPAGTHTLRLDADGWPGGLYLVALETPTTRHTRPLIHRP